MQIVLASFPLTLEWLESCNFGVVYNAIYCSTIINLQSPSRLFLHGETALLSSARASDTDTCKRQLRGSLLSSLLKESRL